ncbi:3-dehydroquinate synthase [Sphingorhabdus soli]|uniref:3-dehydroquinate synthase n=1 Tax=Flavisphingopyxis soli TaxID=2601267 RepID=A0A5C6U9L8_9SPHN|nr:3-dehydroquinate synthase [Sphingorhabdus soli]TXC68871.1 3-dehydroquinate synthase [Sphingorhabdus soli]
MERLTVDLGSRRSDILIAPGLLDRAADFLASDARNARIAVVTDDNVARAQLPRLAASLDKAGIAIDPIVVPAGEASKSWDQLAALCDAFAARGVQRGEAIVALGGGVVGDLAGMAAALHLRGVPIVQIPTSLVAQVDSSVGGKVAVDTKAGKNMAGSFHQPRLVLIDPGCLATLPEREMRAGYAEIVKYGLIGDADFYAFCEANVTDIMARNPDALSHAISRCVAAKARIVEADEDDTAGTRALLNLGHSFGHAFEALAGYDGALLHGEAVAAGMALAYAYSARIGLCDPAVARRVSAHIDDAGLSTRIPDAIGQADSRQIVEFMMRDKKAAGGGLTLILAEDIGRAVLRNGIAPDDVAAFLDETRA